MFRFREIREINEVNEKISDNTVSKTTDPIIEAIRKEPLPMTFEEANDWFFNVMMKEFEQE